MEQQAAGAQRFPVKEISLFVRADMHTVDENLPVVDAAPGILEVDTTLPQGFDLRAAQLNAGL